MTTPSFGGYQPQQQFAPQYAPPQQQFQQPPYGGGYAQGPQGFQQPAQPAAAPTTSADDFFENSGGGGAPSFAFGDVGTGVQGTITKLRVSFRTEMGGKQLKYIKSGPNAGKPQEQLEVTLQTTLRGWQGVKKIPTDTAANGQEIPRDPSLDDGQRRVYLWWHSRDAVGQALGAAGASKLEIGGELTLWVKALLPNTQGDKPIRDFEARYTAPNASSGFFQQPQPGPAAALAQATAPQAPQQQFAPQAPQQQFAPQAPQQQFAPQAPQQQFAQQPPTPAFAPQPPAPFTGAPQQGEPPF